MTKDPAKHKLYRKITALGIPLIVGQLGSVAQQFADTIMIGHYGTRELAAAGFANGVFCLVTYLLLGISYASTPVIGGAFGKHDREGVAQSMLDSIIVNLLASLAVTAVLMLMYRNIRIFHQPEEIVPLILPYFLTLTISVPFMAVANALKQYSDAVGETKMPMYVIIASNIMNVLLNYVLIFGAGNIGVPAMGLYGAGLATLVSRIFMVAAMFTSIRTAKTYRDMIPTRTTRPSAKGMRRIFAIGIPISIQLGLEASSFNVCAIFMGWIGTMALAAHQIMCTISTLCFQIIYGLAAAGSIIIAHYHGRGEHYMVRKAARSTFILGIISLVIILTIIYITRYSIILYFTNTDQVASIIFSIMPCFFIYQLGDCMQITYANALRGIGQVRNMMFHAFIAYLMVSLPLSYILGLVLRLGAVGVWAGMPFGLTTAGILFYTEFRRQT